MPVAYTIGRFQPPTIGHKSLIDAVIKAAEGGEAFVFVSSALSPPDKNPLTSAMKIPILKHMFPDRVTFVDTATCNPSCGGPLNALKWLKEKKKTNITLVNGSARAIDFGPDSRLWSEDNKPDNFVAFGSAERNPSLEDLSAENMSGTKAREFAKRGMKSQFYTALGYDDKGGLVAEVEAIYTKITQGSAPAQKAPPKSPKPAAVPPPKPEAKRRRRGGDQTDEAMTSADAEFEYPPKGGRRRTYRKCRKCGLPVKPETQ